MDLAMDLAMDLVWLGVAWVAWRARRVLPQCTQQV